MTFPEFTVQFTAETQNFFNEHNKLEEGDDRLIHSQVTLVEGGEERELILDCLTVCGRKPIPSSPGMDAKELATLEAVNKMRTPEEKVNERWWIRFVAKDGRFLFLGADCQQDEMPKEVDIDGAWIEQVLKRVSND